MSIAPDFSHDPAVRVDDRVRTTIAGLAGDRTARAVAWRQMIDLLCQPGLASDDAMILTDVVIRAHSGMEEDVRRDAARVAAFGTPPTALVVLLGNDRPVIAASLLSRVELAIEEWRVILPRLSPVARGILRARRDLVTDVRHALASFGAEDFRLSAERDARAVDAPEPGLTRISDLVARIEAYRQTRQAMPPEPVAPPLAAFAFETDLRGVIRWVDAAERSALIGISLAEPAEADGPGVDAAAMGAIRRRSALRDCRLVIASNSAAGGEWRVSASPIFDPDSGRLAGYRGGARRPAPHQRAEAMAGAALSSDALRQLVHELRTPLNAIGGFAELIERQLVGPVAAPYREAAGQIGSHTDLLMAAIDDLDTAARADGGSLVMASETVALDAVVRDAILLHGQTMRERGAELEIAIDPAASIEADPATVARMVNRLFGAVLPVAEQGETIGIALTMHDGWARLTVARPAAFDEARDDDATGALLGIDFAIRLVRGLARACGGQLALETQRLTLSLPATAMSAREDSRG